MLASDRDEVGRPVPAVTGPQAALDGAGAGRPDGRDNLGDIPVRGVHGDISSASASPTDEEPRRNRGAPVLLREWAWGVEPNEPAARLGRIGGALLALGPVGMQAIIRGADDHPESVDVVGLAFRINYSDAGQ